VTLRRIGVWGSTIVAVACALAKVMVPAVSGPGIRMAEAREGIYSNDPKDSWNRIFYILFSRRVEAVMSSEFPEAAPFHDYDGFPGSVKLQVSSRRFERNETGDRAIDPLFPSEFTDVGSRMVLNDPVYTEFRKALEDALGENGQRSAVARAIMQNDLWSAYDILSRDKYYKENGEPELAEHRDELLRLLGSLIRKIALTPGEVRSLSDNYQAVRSQNALPDLFGKNSGWLEVQWFRRRLHDESVDDRRAARVFLKPATAPRNTKKFLNDFRRQDEDQAARLEAVALVTQALVIDTRGRPEPTGLTTEVQIRRFRSSDGKALARTEIVVDEVSRKRLLSEAGAGGLVAEGENDPAYAPSAGNDYSFASRQNAREGPVPPVVVRLRTRCVYCHGSDTLKYLMTFGMAIPPKWGLGPRVRELDRQAHQAAEEVASRKTNGESWKALHRYFEGEPAR
jgi:hypothetical protein